MLQSRWAIAGMPAPGPLAEALHAARLIGAEPELVLHGGGNTSVKLERDGRLALLVKGSGADLARVTAQDYTPLDLEATRALLGDATLDNRSMYAALAPHVLERAAPRPSIETLMHAGLAPAHVIHTHAAPILAIANTRRAATHLRAAFGRCAPVVDYHHSGVSLARACVTAWRAADAACVEGLILAHHGAVTWGQSAGEAYARMLGLANRADAYLDRHGAPRSVPDDARGRAIPPQTLLAIARLRARACRVAGRALIATVRDDGTMRAFARRADLADLTSQGPSTPGHAIFTKRVPLLDGDVERFASAYRSYLGDCAVLDCAPRAVLDPAFGMLALGISKRHADIAADVFAHDCAIMARASALDQYVTIGPDLMRMAEIEYAGFEARVARDQPLAGRVFVIDRALERGTMIAGLLERGAAVAALDANPQVTRLFDCPGYLGLYVSVAVAVNADLACATLIEPVVRAFGGVDVVDAAATWQTHFAPYLAIGNA